MPLYDVKVEAVYDDDGEFDALNKEHAKERAIEYFKEEFGAKKVRTISIEEVIQ